MMPIATQMLTAMITVSDNTAFNQLVMLMGKGDFLRGAAVLNKYLKENGYKRYIVPNTCPDCYTIRDFTEEHPDGTYIICTGSHVVTAINGNYYDSWDSGNEVPIFYYRKEEENAES